LLRYGSSIHCGKLETSDQRRLLAQPGWPRATGDFRLWHQRDFPPTPDNVRCLGSCGLNADHAFWAVHDPKRTFEQSAEDGRSRPASSWSIACHHHIAHHARKLTREGEVESGSTVTPRCSGICLRGRAFISCQALRSIPHNRERWLSGLRPPHPCCGTRVTVSRVQIPSLSAIR
jgi:hypothetical protein